MGYEYEAPLDDALWPAVHAALEGDGALALVTYGPRAAAFQWADVEQSPHAESVDASLVQGVLRIVFHSGTRDQRDAVLARVREHVRAAGADIELVES